MGLVRFALRFPYTFYVVAALIVFLGGIATFAMRTDIFISRPILSTVLALVVVIAGAIAIPILPIARFPGQLGRKRTPRADRRAGTRPRAACHSSRPADHRGQGLRL